MVEDLDAVKEGQISTEIFESALKHHKLKKSSCRRFLDEGPPILKSVYFGGTEKVLSARRQRESGSEENCEFVYRERKEERKVLFSLYDRWDLDLV